MLMGKNKVEFVKGSAKITGKNTIEVEGADGKKRIVNAKNIIFASGSEPTPFPGIPFDEKNIVSSTGFYHFFLLFFMFLLIKLNFI